MSAISATRPSPESHWIRVRVRPPSTSLETWRCRVARGDRRQVRHAEDLVVLSEPLEVAGDLRAEPSPDTSVHLVEDQRRRRAPDGQRAAEREEDPGRLAAGRDRAQGLRILARIRREEELHGLSAADAEPAAIRLGVSVRFGDMGNERHGEARALEAELAEPALDGLLKLGAEGAARRRQSPRGLGQAPAGCSDLDLQGLAIHRPVRHEVQLVPQGLQPLFEARHVGAVLALQPLQQAQAILDVLQARGVGVYSVEEAAQGTARLLELKRRLPEARRGLLEVGHPARPVGHGALRPAQQVERAVLGLGEPVKRGPKLRSQLGGVAQHAPLGAEVLRLEGRGVRLLELAHLKPDEVEALKPLRLPRLEVFELGHQLEPASAPLPIALQGVLQPAKGVHQAELLHGLEQPLVLVLTVDLHQLPGEAAQQLLGHGAVIDVGPCAPVAADGPRQDELQLVLLLPLLQGLGEMLREPASHELAVVIEREDEPALHSSPLGSLADHGGPCPAPQEQLEGVDEEALARAGLPRHRVQPCSKFQRRPFKEGEVLQREFNQHRPDEDRTAPPPVATTIATSGPRLMGEAPVALSPLSAPGRRSSAASPDQLQTPKGQKATKEPRLRRAEDPQELETPSGGRPCLLA